MPGRGPAKKEPINQISELREEEMARYLGIPTAQFKREIEAGEWKGTYKLRNGTKFFIVHLVMDKQRKQALEAITIRSIAA
jgi:hypothetical protein